MRTFYQILTNNLIASVACNFVWFALVFWIYLETRSVFATSIVSGLYVLLTAVTGFWFGSVVDHNKKKTAMLLSSIATLVFFMASLIFFQVTPEAYFQSVKFPQLWILVAFILLGTICGNIHGIVLPTTVTILVEEGKRDKANGWSGSMMGISFAITSVASGMVLGFSGMLIVLLVGVVSTIVAILHLLVIAIPEKKIVHSSQAPAPKLDIKGTIKVIAGIQGLFALLIFNMFNNFIGGVFMSLMDAYGLTLVSVQLWGTLWGLLSLGFIVGGLLIAKFGLGKNPLRTMFLCNTVIWIAAIFFTVQPWILLFIVGAIVWILLIPFIEASEQTIMQKVVPLERQGRVFGFAQSMEQSATPITAFLIGPITQFIFIPFMTNGKGAEWIGSWYGTGDGRGMGLVFSLAGIIGLTFTLLARHSKYYKLLSERYLQ